MKFLSLTLFLAGLLGPALSYDVDHYKKLITDLAKNKEYETAFEENLKDLLADDPNYFDYTPFRSQHFSFNCDSDKSPQTPTSVHALRPGDVQVVGAMGDSITAACGAGASTILGLALEYRGRSWSIGGMDDLRKIVTLPNVLKTFNPNLKGFNTAGDTTVVLSSGAGFNTAISGSIARGMPKQAKTLVERMKASKNIDFENDWKVVTLFVSGNDLCASCLAPNFLSPDNFVTHIRDALDHLHVNMPRTLVNLVQAVNITDIKDMNKGLCAPIHRLICDCGAYPSENSNINDFISAYHEGTRKLVESGRYDTKDDFTVVVQPFLEEFVPPRKPDGKIDFSYLAPDCFHFSTKGHG
jgi:phospholipase B1